MMPKDVKCKYCKKLKNHWCKAVLDSPDEDITRECRHFIHKTNADRIRAMSDDDLSYWIMCPYDNVCESDDVNCIECTKKWLKQPVGEENG